jgi:ribosomal protein L15
MTTLIIRRIFDLNVLDGKEYKDAQQEIIKIIKNKSFLDDELNQEATPLIIAIMSNQTQIAQDLISSGLSRLSYVIPSFGRNALIYAVLEGFEKIALQMISTDESNPDQVDKDGDTALILACQKKMKKVALALINTGESNPGHVNNDNYTALLHALMHTRHHTDFNEVVMSLINTGESNPGHYGQGITALTYACNIQKPDLALALIATGQSNPLQRVSTFDYKTALDICNDPLNNFLMGEVIPLLEQIERDKPEEYVAQIVYEEQPGIINLNEKGFDFVQHNEKIIDDHLKEHEGNICIRAAGKNFLSRKEDISKLLTDDTNLKYGCRTAGNTSAHVLDRNVIFEKTYVNMSPIIGMQVIVSLEQILHILSHNEPDTPRLFVMNKSDESFPSIMSVAYYDGADGESADHCQEGKQTDVYDLFPATGFTRQKIPDDVVSITLPETEGTNLKIQYKGLIYTLNINVEQSSIGNVKDALLQKLLEEDQIESNENKNVKFIYKGKVYQDTSIKLSSIPGLTNGDTLQAMVSDITGGTRRRLSKRKTLKRKIGKRRITTKKIKKRKTLRAN